MSSREEGRILLGLCATVNTFARVCETMIIPYFRALGLRSYTHFAGYLGGFKTSGLQGLPVLTSLNKEAL